MRLKPLKLVFEGITMTHPSPTFNSSSIECSHQVPSHNANSPTASPKTPASPLRITPPWWAAPEVLVGPPPWLTLVAIGAFTLEFHTFVPAPSSVVMMIAVLLAALPGAGICPLSVLAKSNSWTTQGL